MFESHTRMIANHKASVGCARLWVTGGELKLVDPFTGRFLERATCKL
jgi:hypothetical protein